MSRTLARASWQVRPFEGPFNAVQRSVTPNFVKEGTTIPIELEAESHSILYAALVHRIVKVFEPFSPHSTHVMYRFSPPSKRTKKPFVTVLYYAVLYCTVLYCTVKATRSCSLDWSSCGWPQSPRRGLEPWGTCYRNYVFETQT